MTTKTKPKKPARDIKKPAKKIKEAPKEMSRGKVPAQAPERLENDVVSLKDREAVEEEEEVKEEEMESSSGDDMEEAM